MNFIEDLLADIKTKQAGEVPESFKKHQKGSKDSDKDSDDKGDDKDDDKDDKKKKDKDDEKKASALFSELAELNPELKKLASLEAESLFLANLKHSQVFGGSSVKEAALSPADEEQIFNAEFESHTMKLAAADPEYAQIIEREQTKAAFDQGCYEELLAIKQAHNIDDATFGQILAEVGIQ